MKEQKGIFSGNQLKVLALIAMTCDHVGKLLLPTHTYLQIIGRLAYPVFAYMIAEGCIHTKNRRRYLGTLALSALLCQLVYFFVMRSLYQCIMVTFTLSAALISVIDYAGKRQKTAGFGIAALSVTGVYIVTEILPTVCDGFYIDYSFWGVMLPVCVYYTKGRARKIISITIVLILLAADSNALQWFSLGAVPFLALYSGERGKINMKYLFYIYYPVHLVVIYLMGMWM